MFDSANNPPPLLLTKKAAGRELGVSDRTVHRLIKDGALPVVCFGGNVRISREDLQVFIKQQRKGESNGPLTA